MRLRESFTYDNVLDYKFDIIKLLYYKPDDTALSILSRDLLCLYLIDYENAGSEVYDEEKLKEIQGLYDRHCAGDDYYVNMTCGEMREIITKGQENRITVELNKKIAGIFFDLYLNRNQNPYLQITQEKFDEICDNILVE